MNACVQLAVIKVSLIKEYVYVYISVCLHKCMFNSPVPEPVCQHTSALVAATFSFQPETTCSILHVVNPLFPVYLSISQTGAPFIGNYGVVVVYLAGALFSHVKSWGTYNS